MRAKMKNTTVEDRKLNAADVERVKQILPEFDSLPSLLTPEQVSELTNGALKPKSLAHDRCTRNRLLDYVKIGGRVRYPRNALAVWILKNVVQASN